MTKWLGSLVGRWVAGSRNGWISGETTVDGGGASRWEMDDGWMGEQTEGMKKPISGKK